MSLAIYRSHLWQLLEPIVHLLQAPDVGEVLINGPAEVYAERKGRLEREDAAFADEQALMAALRLVSQLAGRPLSAEHPILEACLPDGSRLEAVIPPAAPAGPQVAIRRFFSDQLTLERMVEGDSLDRATATLLVELVSARRNLLVAGGTGTGKTSLLNVLSGFVTPQERLVFIEDARELQPRGSHVVHLEAQTGDAEGKGRVTIRDLLRATLRLRPDRIVVGEVRDAAALEMVHAMLTGHAGCMSTVHASHPVDALHRIETLALMAEVGLPLSALRDQVAAAVDVIVQVARLRCGRRVVEGIYEVSGRNAGGDYRLETLARCAEAAGGDAVTPAITDRAAGSEARTEVEHG